MSSVTSRGAAAMILKGRRNLLAGLKKIPKVQPVALSLQARIGGRDVVDERRNCEEESPRAINPEASTATATGINSDGGSSSLGIRYQTVAGGHFAGKQSRARAAKQQRKIKPGRAPAKKLAKRMGPSTPKRPCRKGPATASTQSVVQPSITAADGLAEPEPMYPVCLGAKARVRKSWESHHVAPKPLGQPAPPVFTNQSCGSPTSSSARITDSATAPATESPATIPPSQTEDASKSSPGSRSTSPSKRQQHANTHSPSADKKRKQAVETSERKAETPRKAKLRKVESPTSPEQDKAAVFIADTMIGPKKDESIPLLKAPSRGLDGKGGATGDCEEAKVKPSASLPPCDLSPSTTEDVNAKLSPSIKEEEKCTPCTAYIEGLEASLQLYTAILRKEGAPADSFTHLTAAHQQTLDAVRAAHQANHVTVKAE